MNRRSFLSILGISPAIAATIAVALPKPDRPVAADPGMTFAYEVDGTFVMPDCENVLYEVGSNGRMIEDKPFIFANGKVHLNRASLDNAVAKAIKRNQMRGRH